jgi:hypothetical protein
MIHIASFRVLQEFVEDYIEDYILPEIILEVINTHNLSKDYSLYNPT